MPTVFAVVHVGGRYVINSTRADFLKRGDRGHFIPTEIAYMDVRGCQRTMHIPFPIADKDIKYEKRSLYCRKDVPLQTEEHAAALEDAVKFLQKKSNEFKATEGSCIFGVKGNVDMKQFELLKIAKIPLYNLENMGCPNLKKLKDTYNLSRCDIHGTDEDDCAYQKVQLFLRWMQDKKREPLT